MDGELREKLRYDKELIKKRVNAEWALLKSLKGAERRQHIIDYYRLHIFVMAVVLFIIGNSVYTYFNPPKEPVVSVAWIGGFITDEQLIGLTNALTYALAYDLDRQIAVVHPFVLMGRPEFDMAQHNRLAAMITGGEIDVVISYAEMDENGNFTADMAPFWAFVNIYPILEEAGLPGDNVIYFAEDGFDYLPHAVFINQSPLLESLNIFTDGLFIGVMSNTRREEVIADVVRFISLGYLQ